MRRWILGLMAFLGMLALTACERASDVASKNLSEAADNFEIMRRIVFINGITDAYLLEVVGYCALDNASTDKKLHIICKDANGIKRHTLGLSDNVTYLIEQVEAVDVSTFHTRVVFRPQTIIPDIDFQGDAEELTTNQNTNG